MQHDLELGYIGLEVPDPASLNGFFGQVIGLMPGEPQAGASTWRNDDRAHRVIVQPGRANDATFLGFEATSEAAYDRVIARLRSEGFGVEDGSDDDLRT